MDSKQAIRDFIRKQVQVLFESVGEPSGENKSLERTFPDYEGHRIIFRLRDLQKKAASFGVNLEYTVNTSPRYSDSERVGEYYHIKVSVDIPKFKVGEDVYNYKGTVERTEAGNLLMPALGYDGKDFVEKYSNKKEFKCYLCNSVRDRRFLHIFQINGTDEDKTFGSNCAERYFGINFLKEIDKIFANLSGGPATDEDGNIITGTRYSMGLSPKSVMLLILLVIEKGQAKPNTYYDLVEDIIRQEDSVSITAFKKAIKKLVPGANFEKVYIKGKEQEVLSNESYSELSEKIFKIQDDILKYWENKQDTSNNFINNAKIAAISILRGLKFHEKNRKLFAWSIYIYLNEKEMEQEKSQELADVGVGGIYKGEIKGLELEVIKAEEKTTRDGRTYLLILAKTPENNLFMIFADSMFKGVKKIKVLNFKGSDPGKYGGHDVLVLKGANIIDVDKQKSLEAGGEDSNKHFGVIKQRYRNMSATIEKLVPRNDYRLVFMKLDTGELIYTYNSSETLNPGEKVRIDFTVDSYKDFKGENSTYVNRVVFHQ